MAGLSVGSLRRGRGPTYCFAEVMLTDAGDAGYIITKETGGVGRESKTVTLQFPTHEAASAVFGAQIQELQADGFRLTAAQNVNVDDEGAQPAKRARIADVEEPAEKKKEKSLPEDDIPEGETRNVGDYVLKNIGGVYSCSCVAWKMQKRGIERRTCKHLRELRGDDAEDERLAAFDEEDGGGRRPAAPRAARFGVLLAQKWDAKVDPTGWWMSEKLDGVRCYWDGSTMWSRTNKEFYPPVWFLEGFPKDTPLDGELFLGRGQFDKCSGIVRRQDRSDMWKQLRYLVFDAPASSAPFEERLDLIRKVLSAEKTPYAVAHPHERCRGRDHLDAELEVVEKKGGEGLMLRKPGSAYVHGRSSVLLKVKTFLDAEAEVVGHDDGKGKHRLRMGALRCRTADGVDFKVGTGFSDAQRDDPPPIGSIITFKCQELTKAGVPRFPAFVRIRHDMDHAAFLASGSRRKPAG